MSKPTKPAGCFLQLAGGALAIYAAVSVGTEDYVKAVIYGILGIALMALGRTAIK